MTNYSTYPKHRLENNSCIICFKHGGFSWCTLHNSQRLYLLNSDYLDDAYKIDVKFYSGKFYSFDLEGFKNWLRINSKPVQKKELIENED